MHQMYILVHTVTVGKCIWALPLPSQQQPYPLLHIQGVVLGLESPW